MLDLYKKFYADRCYEQKDLFSFLAKTLKIKSFLYPGSFVHISPSFFIPYGCYVDNDRQARQFFLNTSEVEKRVQSEAEFSDPVCIQYYDQDYTKPLPVKDQSFDLLISQYAGFICQPCKRYLRNGGYLLVNNSHGDAGIAALDDGYSLYGVFNRRNDQYCFSQTDLGSYFIPKKLYTDLKAHITQTKKGIGYKKTATLYLFQRL